MAWTSGTISYVSSTTTGTSVTVSWSATITYSNRTYGTFDVRVRDSSGVDHAIGTIPTYTTTSGSTTSQTRTVTGSGTWSGLNPSTTYSTNKVVQVGPSSGILYAESATFNFTTQSPPSLYSYPSLSGTGVSGTSLSASAGSYSAGTISSTKIAYSTSTGVFANGTTSAPNSRTSPYTVVDGDASSPPYYFAAMDTVSYGGTNWYFFSSSQISYLKVSFNSQSGDAVSPIPYIANSSSPNSITLPYTSRTGYVFDGWYTAATGGSYVGGAYSSYQPSTSASTTLYARWSLPPAPSAPTYLYATNGSYTDKISLSFGGASGTISGFHIWFNTYASGYPTNSSTPDFTVTTSNTYGSYDNTGLSQSTNRWYWVRAYGPGGNSAWYPAITGSPIPDGIAGSTYTPPPPSKYYSPSISGDAVAGTSLTVSSGGYSNAASVSTSIAYQTSSSFVDGVAPNAVQSSPYTVTTQDASHAAYYFAAVDTVTGDNGQIYYFYSSPIQSGFYVNFNIQDGDYQPSSIKFISNTSTPNSITLPYTYRSNYIFTGWHTASIGGTHVGDSYASYTPPTDQHTTLYAVWKLYAPTYLSTTNNTSTGVVLSWNSSVGATKYGIWYNTYAAGSPTYTSTEDFSVLSPNTTYTDISLGLGGTKYYWVRAMATLPVLNSDWYPTGDGYSGYRAKAITYNFDGQLSSYLSDSTVGPVDENNYMSLPTTTRTGYTFNGWYSDVGGGGEYIGSSGGSLYLSTTFTTTYPTDSTFYAFWTATQYTVTFNANGGTVSPSSMTIMYNDQYGSLPVPVKIGYAFDGWYTSLDYTDEVTETDVYLLETDSTIYAKWSVGTYTVTFDANGGTVSPSTKSVTYNSAYGTLPTPTRAGYAFNGWFTSISGGTEVTSTTIYTVGANTTIHAQWTASLPVFTDETVATTGILNHNFSADVEASPVTSYSIIYDISMGGLDPRSWLSVLKQPSSNIGLLSGKPPQIGVYTFKVRATNDGSGYTDSGLITLTVSPAGKRLTSSSSSSQLSTAKRFDGSAWVNLEVMRRFDGTQWQDISII